MKKRLADIAFIIVGAFFFALAVNLYVIPNEFGEGGVVGVTIILYYLFHWSPSVVNLVINGLLLIIGYKFLDARTTLYTVIAVAFNSLFLHLTADWRIDSHEPTINAVFAGVLVGIGIGLIVRVGGTTAGTVILARIANKYLDWNISYALLFFDLIVAFSSYFIIGPEKLMLTIVILYVGTKVMDFMIEGLNPKKAVMIISEQQDKIAEMVITQMDRGVTVLSGHGYYTKNPKEVLYIVISKQEVSALKKIVKAVDTAAFITIHDVRDVFGEGFLDISK
ncbi:YitT family protein [Paenibacillus kribbensis]|uniref:YitT family protein n=1 Tax=Paenibacillus TaxID=44249 RepID=UPI00024F0373|nr:MULTISPECIES: YitT family protein [Paenibacillus]EHS59275.1 efflux transporter [Paenibacillus sp. Aloe-11]MEC0234694.1 YitT family protein [Paenibacillus kribbensis]